jgi:hypothetical protein
MQNVKPCSPMKSTDVSEEHVASIFKVEEETKWESSTKQEAKQNSAGAASCSVFSLTLKVVTCSSETSADFQRTIRVYILEERIIHNHRCENLKS